MLLVDDEDPTIFWVDFSLDGKIPAKQMYPCPKTK